MPIQAHRVSAYVHGIVHLPRIFFDGPDCRLCSLHAGNEPEHVFACPALYVRACGALISCVDTLLSDMGWQVQATWDLVALLTHGSRECWFAVEPHNTIAARQRALRSWVVRSTLSCPTEDCYGVPTRMCGIPTM